MRILFLADQPWQLKLIESIINNLRIENNSVKASIALVDIYTFLHAPQLISKVSSNLEIEIDTLEEIFAKWQKIKCIISKEEDEFLSSWAKANSHERTISQIEKSNQWIYGFENEVFYKKTTKKWKRKFLIDTTIWCESIMKKEQYDLIFSVERATLPVNLLWSISRSRQIPFLTLFHSRVQYNWVLQDNFGFGTSQEILKIANSKEYSEANLQTEKYLELFHQSRIGSYESFEHRTDLSPATSTRAMVKDLILELRRFLGRVWSRMFKERKNFKFKVRRFEQNLLKLSIFDLKIIVYTFLVRNRIMSIEGNKIPGDYFFWALHARPEGSVQALSGGVDEISLLRNFASLLPEGVMLQVKENSLMLGRRRLGFYRELNSIHNVNIVGLNENTYSLIENSKGVAGLTGTVLLESAILNKPSFTFGNPEFKDFIFSRNILPVDQFINLSLKESLPENTNSTYGYISYCLNHGVNAPLYDFDEFATGAAQYASKQISNKLNRYLTEVLDSEKRN
jgi:hypothetical protein